jgi:hypothetical protein
VHGESEEILCQIHPLLGHDRKTNETVAGQCPTNKISAFSVLSVPRLYSRQQLRLRVSPCGGGFEYLHRSSTSISRMLRKGNPVPGVITGPPCSCGIYTWGHGPPGWWNLDFEKIKYGLNPAAFRPKADWAGKAERDL